MIDPYASNPLADEMREREGYRFEQVAAVKEPPRMFGGGTSDIPAFTASGIDPQLLLKLPAGIRHAAAANPDIVQVHDWFEQYAQYPEAEIDHPGLREAKLRMEDWLSHTDLDTRTPEQREADDAAEYAQFYNPTIDRASHAIEQKRRADAGEQPLEDFDAIQLKRSWIVNAAASAPEAPTYPGLSEQDLRRLADMVNGGRS